MLIHDKTDFFNESYVNIIHCVEWNMYFIIFIVFFYEYQFKFSSGSHWSITVEKSSWVGLVIGQ